MFILFVMLLFVLERMVKRDMPVSAYCLWLTHLGYSCKNSLYNHCQMSVRTYKGPALNSSFAMCSYKIQQHTVGGERQRRRYPRTSATEGRKGEMRKRYWKRGWQRLKKETILDTFSTDCVCVCFPQRERSWGKETDLIASQKCSKECLDLRFPPNYSEQMNHASAPEMALKNDVCKVTSRPNELGFLMTAEFSNTFVKCPC